MTKNKENYDGRRHFLLSKFCGIIEALPLEGLEQLSFFYVGNTLCVIGYVVHKPQTEIKL